MVTENGTKTEETLRRLQPTPVREELRAHLLAAMLQESVAVQKEVQECDELRARFSPASVPSALRTRLLGAMRETVKKQRFHVTYRRVAAAVAAVILLPVIAFLLIYNHDNDDESYAVTAELPLQVLRGSCGLQRSITPAGENTAYSVLSDTFLLQDADSSTIRVRVSSQVPNPIPDDVI